MITVRACRSGDHPWIDEVVRTAFLAKYGSDDEVRLVRDLRHAGDVVLEQVACIDDEIVGHVLFSRLKTPGELALVALAPVSVLPTHQKAAIGAKLVRNGLSQLEAADEDGAVVLGDPAYYVRFGFRSDLARRLIAPFSGPALMALEWRQGSILDGTPITYAEAFGITPQA
jgi:putative acetyltransferase